MLYEEIGRRIFMAREEAGLSQEELASLLGLTQAALSNYELGKRRIHLVGLEGVARALNKPLGYFIDEPEPEPDAREEKRLDEAISEMISLWYEMPESEREYLLEYFRWRRDRQKES
jgi:transcriptional regulator with XRE-family HTH domain